uniref:Uncharacterized protein n=1 Tax=Arundo donax TaxID=35708 RepID=A0A0A9G2U1_ARUDO
MGFSWKINSTKAQIKLKELYDVTIETNLRFISCKSQDCLLLYQMANGLCLLTYNMFNIDYLTLKCRVSTMFFITKYNRLAGYHCNIMGHKQTI